MIHETGSLFKYKSVDTQKFQRDIDSFQNNCVWFTGIDQLNDPFEGELSVLKREDCENEFYDQFYVPYKKKIDELIKKSGIFSLSHTKNNLIMWCHYADNHKGYCVEYDFSTPEIMNLNSEVQVSCLKVNYLNRPRDYSNLASFYEFYLSEKSKGWRYEKETRYISNKIGYHQIPENSIKAIYLGANMNKNDEKKIISLCREKRIKVYKSFIIQNSYNMKFKSLK